MITQWYHAWADGQWVLPLSEHIDWMSKSDFRVPLRMGVIGKPQHRDGLYRWLDKKIPGQWELAAEADEGFEEVTLMAVRDWALHNDGNALYMHDKGALNANSFEAQWRNRVTGELVGRWQHCQELLTRADAVGCHWLHPDQDWPRAWPLDGNVIRVSHQHFSGNFFWATAGYLRELPEWPYEIPHYPGCCTPDSVPQTRGETTGRWLGELWIGLGNPRICDLYPGLPGEYARRNEFTLTWSRG